MPMHERILAMDLATVTGLCVGEPDEVPTLSHHRLPSTGENVGAFLDAAEQWASALVRDVEPIIVVFEAPVLPSTIALATLRKLHGLAGVVEMVVHRAGVECAELSPTAVKKNLTGSGASKKPDMLAACRHYGFDPACDDEADAFGVWLTTVRTRFPLCASRWDPMNFARRA